MANKKQQINTEKILQERQSRAKRIFAALKHHYGQVICTLDAKEDAWQLIVAAILAAQCTDARVNMVTPDLFLAFPTPQDFATSSPEAIEPYISSCGLFRNKAKAIYRAANTLLAEFKGEVPATMEKLLKLPGVGRKIANLILGEIYSQPAVVVDTHCGRISRLLGLVDTTKPERIERELMQILPEAMWTSWGHYMVTHGRAVCLARRPQCGQCFIKEYCQYGQEFSKS